MRYCNACQINISTLTDRCPLCHQPLPKDDDQCMTKTYPPYAQFAGGKRKLIMTAVITSLVLLAAAVFLNILTWNGNLWCAIFSGCLIYAWFLALVVFKKRIHLAFKLVTHAIVISLLMIIINIFDHEHTTVSHVSWAVSYAMPIIFSCSILAILIGIAGKKQTHHDFFLYLLTLCVIGFIPLILVLCDVARPLHLSIITAGWSFITIVCVAFFMKKIIRLEFVKKFHL